MNTNDHVTCTNDFNQIVLGRRSIKKYDSSIKISREEMSEILSKATQAPSSFNLQPWRFLVIESEEAKATLLPLADFNSQQVQTSAAVIAIFGDLKHDSNVNKILDTAVEHEYMPVDVKEQLLSLIRNFYSKAPESYRKDVVLTDGGLVAMQLMLVARAHGYDTNPIGGYDKERIAEAFGMDKDRYVPIMLVSIGKADDDGHPSVRLPLDDVTEWK